MKVQRIQLPPDHHYSWLVLDDAFLPIQPISSFLQFLEHVGRSPNTIRASAHHLKFFWEFLRDQQLDWKQVDVQHLAGFITWLRRPRAGLLSSEGVPHAPRTDATIDQMLTAVHGFYDHHVRMKTVPALPLYQFLNLPQRRYKSFLYGFVKSKPVRTRVVKVQREGRVIKTLNHEQVELLLNACTHLRDRFLLKLLYETGMRIGQTLGLRHEDIKPEENELHIVPREDNANGARAKTRAAYIVPLQNTEVMQFYVDYVIQELNGLEVDHLPDYVFVNLWEGDLGRPMSYSTVIAFFRRLEHQTKIYARPHLFRHTRATKWIREDKLSLGTVSRLLGHASIQTTHDLYVHLTADDLREELKRSSR